MPRLSVEDASVAGAAMTYVRSVGIHGAHWVKQPAVWTCPVSTDGMSFFIEARGLSGFRW